MGRGVGGKRKALLTWPTVETLFLSTIWSERQGNAGGVESGYYVSTSIVIPKAVKKG